MQKMVKISACVMMIGVLVYMQVQSNWLTDKYRAGKEKIKQIAKDEGIEVGTIKQDVGRAFGEGVSEAGKIVGVVTEPIKTGVSKIGEYTTDPVFRMVGNQMKAIKDNPHRNDVASVRMGAGLPQAEIDFVNKRTPLTQKALEKLLGRSLAGARTPRIAFCGSGGGYRAMVCSMGSLVGAEKIGLMDCATYYAGLSGSTWLAPWFLMGGSIASYKESLIPKLNYPSLAPVGSNKVHDVSLIMNELVVKRAMLQPRTIVDLYGLLLGNRLLDSFGDDRHRVYLSQQAQSLADGRQMMFIGTAVTGYAGMAKEWFEFTPYEVGSAWLGMYVPTWAFGRMFQDGKSIDPAPEQPLDILMGVFGSAFAADAEVIYQDSLKGMIAQVTPVVEGVLSADYLGELKVTSGKFNNFAQGFAQSGIKDKDVISLIDAGLAFNLPTPPLCRPERAVDVIFILDASAGQVGAELLKAEQYARDKKMPFPAINYANIEKRAMSVFVDANPKAPIVIYLPRVFDAALWEKVKDLPEYAQYKQYFNGFNVDECIASSYCNTFNFKYTDFQARQLSAVTEFNIVANKQEIIKVLNDAVDRR